MDIVQFLDENIWRRFIEGNPQANIFHTPEMFQVFSRAAGHSISLWAAVDEYMLPLALLTPVRVSLRDGLFYPWATRAVAYGSILVSSSPAGTQGLRMLLNGYSQSAQGQFLFTELRNMSALDDFQEILNECSYTYEDHLDYLVDLALPEDQLWQNLSKSCRQRIKHSLSRGTQVEEVSTYEQLLAAYGLLKDLYSRIRVPLAQYSLFEAAYDICGPPGMCKIFLARIDDQYIGCSFNLVYKNRVLAWYSASDRQYAEFNPGELLKWHVFQWAKANGYHQFDFGGAGKPNDAYGPRDFKAKFGGKLVNFGRNSCVHSPARFQISKSLYSIARKVSVFS
jgi:serine/alanine adding enzyme